MKADKYVSAAANVSLLIVLVSIAAAQVGFSFYSDASSLMDARRVFGEWIFLTKVPAHLFPNTHPECISLARDTLEGLGKFSILYDSAYDFRMELGLPIADSEQFDPNKTRQFQIEINRKALSTFSIGGGYRFEGYRGSTKVDTRSLTELLSSNYEIPHFSKYDYEFYDSQIRYNYYDPESETQEYRPLRQKVFLGDNPNDPAFKHRADSLAIKLREVSDSLILSLGLNAADFKWHILMDALQMETGRANEDELWCNQIQIFKKIIARNLTILTNTAPGTYPPLAAARFERQFETSSIKVPVIDLGLNRFAAILILCLISSILCILLQSLLQSIENDHRAGAGEPWLLIDAQDNFAWWVAGPWLALLVVGPFLTGIAGIGFISMKWTLWSDSRNYIECCLAFGFLVACLGFSVTTSWKSVRLILKIGKQRAKVQQAEIVRQKDTSDLVR